MKSINILSLLAVIFLAVVDAIKPANVIPGRFIVEFPLTTDDVKHTGDAFLERLQEVFPDISFSIPRTFNHKFMKGITIQIDDLDGSTTQSQRLHQKVYRFATDSGFADKVHHVHTLARPQATTSGSPAPFTSNAPNARHLLPHKLTQVDRIHREFNNTGQGIVIGILDSGIDYMHPALGGGFGEGFKVRYGRDLVGDNYGSTSMIPEPDNDPMDACGEDYGQSGHGTHVAGIIGGHNSENFTSVAPGATLGMWRVFGCAGGTADDVIIEALIDAYDAGVDVINLSLGSPDSWSESPTAVVAERIVVDGVPVIASAGNSGQFGAFTVGAPSTGKGVVSVSSVDNTHTLYDYINVDGVKEAFKYQVAKKSLGKSITVPDGYIVAGDRNIGSTHDACNATDIPLNVRGKLALAQRGECTFDRKVAHLQEAGAIGVIIYNHNENATQAITPSIISTEIPVIEVTHEVGVEILNAIEKAGHRGAQVTNVRRVEPYVTGMTVSSFSSIGPTFDNELKPAFGGIGGQVYSTVPSYLGNWKVLSGTSMSAPYVAGTYALYLKAMRDMNKTHSPKFIQEQFQNYAFKTLSLSSHVPNATVDSPARQGGGLVQVYDAIYQEVHVSPGSIAFNDTANLHKSHKLTITNHGDSTASYKLVNKVSVSISPFNASGDYSMAAPPIYGSSSAKLRFSRKNIKVSPGKSVDVTISVIPPKTDPDLHIIYGGYVEFKSQLDDQKDITVPYMGLVGNQRDIPIFAKDTPILLNNNMTLHYNETDVYEYSLSDNSTDAPQIVVFLNVGTRIITSTLQTDKGKDVGLNPLLTDEYLGRTIGVDGYLTYPWDGTYLPPHADENSTYVEADPGRYRIVVRALRLLGNPDKKSDWDTWKSPVIRVT
ncbi:peptidase S8/S53 domain-containing protein [Fennellomyces sp. T-0311]|nr:peptidase S8/S53 domain-containing protein [Fennellomyces sp. T-0311]